MGKTASKTFAKRLGCKKKSIITDVGLKLTEVGLVLTEVSIQLTEVSLVSMEVGIVLTEVSIQLPEASLVLAIIYEYYLMMSTNTYTINLYQHFILLMR